MLVFLLLRAWLSPPSSSNVDRTALPEPEPPYARSWTEQEGTPAREEEQKRRLSPHSSALQTTGGPNCDVGELLALAYFLQESGVMFSIIQNKKSR